MIHQRSRRARPATQQHQPDTAPAKLDLWRQSAGLRWTTTVLLLSGALTASSIRQTLNKLAFTTEQPIESVTVWLHSKSLQVKTHKIILWSILIFFFFFSLEHTHLDCFRFQSRILFPFSSWQTEREKKAPSRCLPPRAVATREPIERAE